MSRVLVLGTNNRHKAGEIAPLLAGLDLELSTAGEYGPFDPSEDGATLTDNALLKARAASELSGQWAIADDTGLFVEALGGRPGIHAARYAGPGCTFADNIRKLLQELQGVEESRRAARFTCVIAFCRPGLAPRFFQGDITGRILTAPAGAGGFGYDPVFYIEQLGKTFAQLTTEEKNRLSHRALAVRKLREVLARLLTERPGV